jgi:hypothetical protein
VRYWSTIRMADVDGDGRPDLCGRGPNGFECHLSTGAGFASEAAVAPLADANGWWDHSNYATIRLGDVDGDGDLDLCARADAGIRCWPWEDGAFGADFSGPELSDDAGWDDFRFYTTLRLADIDGDGRADLCGRGSGGVRCWPSRGSSFGEAIPGPALTDDSGWSDLPYFTTFRAASGSATTAPGDSALEESPPEGPPIEPRAVPGSEGCGCSTGGGGRAGTSLILLLLLARFSSQGRARPCWPRRPGDREGAQGTFR